MDKDVLNLLACPRDHLPLTMPNGHSLRCNAGHEYPIVDGIPVFLLDNEEHMIDAAAASLARSRGDIKAEESTPELYLESLGISQLEKDALERLWQRNDSTVDPVVQYLVGATCGNAYRGLIGKLKEYPIPHIPVPTGDNRTLLDIGCNWGRWSIAAARKGYKVIGIDPQLGAVVAAQRVSKKLGHDVTYLCADARFLPLRSNSVDVAFSYSVLQHFSPTNCEISLGEVGRVLFPGGLATIQMANILGIRSLYQIMRRGFKRGHRFDVRYYLPSDMKRLFEANIGKASISVDCFFGLGLQEKDIPILTGLGKAAAISSVHLRNASRIVGGLTWLADSLYIRAVKPCNDCT